MLTMKARLPKPRFRHIFQGGKIHDLFLLCLTSEVVKDDNIYAVGILYWIVKRKKTLILIQMDQSPFKLACDQNSLI